MADFYAAKMRAAIDLKRWVFHLAKEKRDGRFLEDRVLRNVRKSLDAYKELAKESECAYVGGTDFPRLTPIPDVRTWSQVLPTYEKELADLPAQFDKARIGVQSPTRQ
jgi:hypothetical protein